MSAPQPVSRGTRIAAMLVALFCLNWLLLAAWGAAQYRQATHFGPVLYDPISVAVDPADGTIYCASSAGRVQKYGADGRGRGAFSVDAVGAGFRIKSEGPGLVAMAIEGLDRVVVFDEGGRVASEREEAGAWAAWGDSARFARTGDGAHEILLVDGALIERPLAAGGEDRLLVPALEFPLTFFAAEPWALVFSLFFSTLGLMAAFIWPFLARSGDDTVR